MNTLFQSEPIDVEPIVSKNQDSSSPLTAYLESFLRVKTQEQAAIASGPTIRVSEVLGTIARLYERIRNTVEYKGEQVLRRNAIERILKRLLWERSHKDTQKIASLLLRELIWARYIPNDAIPKHKSSEVAAIIAKYQHLLGLLQVKGLAISHDQVKNWVWGIASCEIEEALDIKHREPFVQLMYAWFTQYFRWENEGLAEHEKQAQIYLAVHRALTKSDEHVMRYHLLLHAFPDWKKDPKVVEIFAHNFYGVYERIEKQLNFPDRFNLYRLVQKQVAAFDILRDLIEREGAHVRSTLSDPDIFEQKVREICAIRYNQIQKKVRTGIIRSIIYIFVTKVIFALIIEIPYELYRLGHLTYLPLGINVVVPPLMMLVVGLTIQAPDETNTIRLLSRLKTIVYRNEHVTPHIFSLTRARRSSSITAVFAIIYAALFLLVFGGISYLLLSLHFTIVGIFIFFAFLSLVMLFGYRVRFTAQELKVTGEKENIFSYLLSNLSLPFLRVGVYLSKGLAKINIFTVILDFLIEAPLKTVIEVIEEWTSYMREKREEVVEVPQ
ncbi:hypothetical protein C4579_00670 [Candidatus Microgenomates bacterium]|nr:MAG: hypothetical protein C4579_00670 [Candidatus Microgenomates bacterium]